ncbi:hypothetical protein H5410_038996 [Solanum commersonii]|uniref:Uncharacterized protein n=1 Tax=Solanum commersonii TaxID=4109 RepID=A0A9J5YET6_SOLCO|nr:hypothetical protein H5410_038996 [Solanum commersonii]
MKDGSSWIICLKGSIRRDSYDRFHQEFFTSVVNWERLGYCLRGRFLGIMIFPKKKRCVDINLAYGHLHVWGPIRVTIVPMILAEMFRSLSLCSRGYDHFKEVTYCRKFGRWNTFIKGMQKMTPVEPYDKIRSHATRLGMWDAPNDVDGWRFSDPPHGNRDSMAARKNSIEKDHLLWYKDGSATFLTRHGVESRCTPKYYTWFMIGEFSLGLAMRESWDGGRPREEDPREPTEEMKKIRKKTRKKIRRRSARRSRGPGPKRPEEETYHPTMAAKGLQSITSGPYYNVGEDDDAPTW